MSKSRRTIWLLALVLCAGGLAAAAVTARGISYRSPGTTDFLQYWSAFQLFRNGENPYDDALLYPIQRTLGHPQGSVIMMWNPPWVLVLLSPVLWLEFPGAVVCWLALNIAFLFLVAALVCRVTPDRPSSFAPAVISAAVFYPAWNCAQLGQLSLLITLGAALVFRAVCRRQDLAAGAALVLLTLKPHLGYLVLLVFLGEAVVCRRYRLLAGFSLCWVLLALATQLVCPTALSSWLEVTLSGRRVDLAVPVAEWRVATLVGLFRHWLAQSTGHPPAWPMWVVPAVTACAVLSYHLFRARRIDWREGFVPLLILSYMTSPYGWLFDQSLLVIAQVCMVCEAMASPASGGAKVRRLLPLIALQVGMIITGTSAASEQHHFVWFPPALLMVWLWFRRSRERATIQSQSHTSGREPEQGQSG